MTNAEKYLKDEVNVEEFVNELQKYYSNYIDKKGYSGVQDLNKYIVIDFFNAPVQPTLIEDERVILRNIDTRLYPTIKRTKMGEIIVISNAKCGDDIICYMYCYDHLFQFIKERRRI